MTEVHKLVLWNLYGREVHKRVRVCEACTHTHAHTHAHMHMHTHTHVHAHTWANTHASKHMHTCTYGHAHTCAHRHTHTCVRTRTHTRTHTFCAAVLCSVPQSCPTLCDPEDCSPPGSSSMGILQASRILEWVAMPSSWEFSQPRAQPRVSCTTGRFFIIWVTKEGPHISEHFKVWVSIRNRPKSLASNRKIFNDFKTFPKYTRLAPINQMKNYKSLWSNLTSLIWKALRNHQIWVSCHL